MYFADRYKDLIKSAEELKEELGEDIEFENDIITCVDIEISGHFGNIPSLVLKNRKGICLVPSYNNKGNLGEILALLFDFFDTTDDNWQSINELVHTPIRVVYDDWRVVAIGHFMEDRYLIVKDFMSMSTKDNNKTFNRVEASWEVIDRDPSNGMKCYKCPECGTEEWRHEPCNFCPNCAADMRRE